MQKLTVSVKGENYVAPNGWLDCSIIQSAQVLLQKINPLIEGFQRPTLGPVRNFSIVSSEFVYLNITYWKGPLGLYKHNRMLPWYS